MNAWPRRPETSRSSPTSFSALIPSQPPSPSGRGSVCVLSLRPWVKGLLTDDRDLPASGVLPLQPADRCSLQSTPSSAPITPVPKGNRMPAERRREVETPRHVRALPRGLTSPRGSSQRGTYRAPVAGVCALESMLLSLTSESSLLYIIGYYSSFTANSRCHQLWDVFPGLSAPPGFSPSYHTELVPSHVASLFPPAESAPPRAKGRLLPPWILPTRPGVPGPWLWLDVRRAPSILATPRGTRAQGCGPCVPNSLQHSATS